MLKILIATHNDVLYQGLASIFNKMPSEFCVLGNINHSSLATGFSMRYPADITLVDLFLPDQGGFWVTQQIKAYQPSKVILMIPYPNDFYQGLALHSKADGWVFDYLSSTSLIQTIDAVQTGQFERKSLYTKNDLFPRQFYKPFSDCVMLTPKQADVFFRQVFENQSPEEIAALLNIEESSVNKHRREANARIHYRYQKDLTDILLIKY